MGTLCVQQSVVAPTSMGYLARDDRQRSRGRRGAVSQDRNRAQDRAVAERLFGWSVVDGPFVVQVESGYVDARVVAVLESDLPNFATGLPAIVAALRAAVPSHTDVELLPEYRAVEYGSYRFRDRAGMVETERWLHGWMTHEDPWLAPGSFGMIGSKQPSPSGSSRKRGPVRANQWRHGSPFRSDCGRPPRDRVRVSAFRTSPREDSGSLKRLFKAWTSCFEHTRDGASSVCAGNQSRGRSGRRKSS